VGLDEAVDDREQLLFVERLLDAGSVADGLCPVGGAEAGVPADEEAGNTDARFVKAIAQIEAAHAGELNVNHKALHAGESRIVERTLSGLVNTARVIVRTQQARYGLANGRVIVNERDTNRSCFRSAFSQATPRRLRDSSAARFQDKVSSRQR